MHNLIEYSDNYSDTSGSLWKFKRDDANNDDFEIDHSKLFKYKAALAGKKLIIMVPIALKKHKNSCSI